MVKLARQLLDSQELQRQERRERRWAELAEQLLQSQHAEGVAVVSEERLYVLAYQVVRGERMAALSTAQANDLRRVTRRVWTETHGTACGIEEAATAEAASDSNSPDGRGSTAVVSGPLDGGDRSSSPATPTACCDAPVLRDVECPRCYGQKGAHGGNNDGGDRGELVWFDCGQCEGAGTVPQCESCGEVIS